MACCEIKLISSEFVDAYVQSLGSDIQRIDIRWSRVRNLKSICRQLYLLDHPETSFYKLFFINYIDYIKTRFNRNICIVVSDCMTYNNRPEEKEVIRFMKQWYKLFRQRSQSDLMGFIKIIIAI